jgi:ubiquitin-conjugating enzyme/von Willebrand factor type A domain-containing protein
MEFVSLSAITADRNPVSKRTTIHELKDIAKQRVYSSQDLGEAPLLPNSKIELSLAICALRTKDEKETLIGDLGYNGSLERPLNLFVFPIADTSADFDKPHTLWPFESSERGIATFQTCLRVFLSHIINGELADGGHFYRSLLKTLFRITHFPPVLEAFQILKDENRLEPRAVTILATCMRELTLRIAPPAMYGNDLKSVLQCSRQMFAWIESQCRLAMAEPDNPQTTLVRPVTFEELDISLSSVMYIPGKRSESVRIVAAGEPNDLTSTSIPRHERLIRVIVPQSCTKNLRLLALVLWGHYSELGNYYIDFTNAVERPVEHQRTPLPTKLGFPVLLREANKSAIFQIVSPENLNETNKTVITVNDKGLLCESGTNRGRYELTGKTTMGQGYQFDTFEGFTNIERGTSRTISDQLRQLIEEWKRVGTWTPDDWDFSEPDSGADLNPTETQEAIVICFDLSGSMESKMGMSWVGGPNDFTKFNEISQVFENTIARLLAYQMLDKQIGVVTFAERSKLRVARQISQLKHQEFRDMLGNFTIGTYTSLWDALDKAKDMLLEFKSCNPEAKLRIIALTDGEDNDSLTSPEDICRALYDAEIVLDSVVVSGSSRPDISRDLFKISKHTGGYAFRPTSRLLLFQVFILEPFLDISVRPDIQRIVIQDFRHSEPKQPDMQTIYDFPPCRPHHLDEGSFIALRDAFEGSTANAVRRPASFASLYAPSRILLSEMTHAAAAQRNHPLLERVDIYFNEADLTYWKVVMKGPPDTPYENGTFVISVHITREFPRFAPLVRFITPILHPNITKVWYKCFFMLS